MAGGLGGWGEWDKVSEMPQVGEGGTRPRQLFSRHQEGQNCSGESTKPFPLFCVLGAAEIMVSNWVSS